MSCFENVIGEEDGGYKLFQPPEQPILKVSLQWAGQKEVLRYSSRHGQNIMRKGIVGKVDLTGVSEEWLDLLLAGEVAQIGKIPVLDLENIIWNIRGRVFFVFWSS